MTMTMHPSDLEGSTPVPLAPRKAAETGLEEGFLLGLMMKIVVRLGCERPSEISRAMRLRVRVVEELLEIARLRGLVEHRGQPNANFHAEMRFMPTDRGRNWAAEAFALSEWVGPTPVTLDAFLAQARAQSVRDEVLTRARLDEVFSGLVIEDTVMRKIGPAANSGASILLYGPAGNGKSSIAEALCQSYQGVVFLPHAIEVDNQVITLFDPSVHVPLDQETAEDGALRRRDGQDMRFVACRRPAVIAGGELNLDMLDLTFSATSRVYEAPTQLKAAGGIFVVDDFGRQRHEPQDFVNRLIIPLEKKVDYLTLDTGRKFQTPFDLLMVFSTNTPPNDLLDDAGLRRLRHKILIGSPDREAFIRIFVSTASQCDLRLNEEVLAYVLVDLYGQHPELGFQAFHPKFLIEQAQAICAYEGIEPVLTSEIMRRAWDQLLASSRVS
ncbi:MAG: hypothetical protein AAGG06_18075 [Pseudomonadota bacterium]